jgi:uncharacterized protein (TIGR02466 family)
MKIGTMFSQLMSYDKIESKNLQNLVDYIYSMREIDPIGNKISNSGGWQSKNLTKDDEFYIKFNNLILSIEDEANNFFDSSGYHGIYLRVQNFWININYPKTYNHHHMHGGSILSGVFYVKVPKNSGNIIFSNPSANLKDAYIQPLLTRNCTTTFNSFTSSNLSLTPEENYFLVFPSWQEHWVEQNESDEDRLSIAFNFFPED